jgi:hypothetical protein
MNSTCLLFPFLPLLVVEDVGVGAGKSMGVEAETLRERSRWPGGEVLRDDGLPELLGEDSLDVRCLHCKPQYCTIMQNVLTYRVTPSVWIRRDALRFRVA